jgi:LemA protein
MQMAAGIIIGVVVLVGLYVMSTYNGLVVLRNRVKNAFSQIDVQLKRRYDLIPNLVEAAKGYMNHEKETLTAVIEARNKAVAARDVAAQDAISGQAIGALSAAEGQLAGAMNKFLALAESYPDLKANQNITTLMEELTSTENKVGFARQAFNDVVTQLNIAVEQFPASLIAKTFEFTAMPQLEVIKADGEREAPKVAFN